VRVAASLGTHRRREAVVAAGSAELPLPAPVHARWGGEVSSSDWALAAGFLGISGGLGEGQPWKEFGNRALSGNALKGNMGSVGGVGPCSGKATGRSSNHGAAMTNS
jgi:hypothetical protein